MGLDGRAFGALLVTVSVIVVPRPGATALMGAIVAGQMLASLLLDHFGLIGFPVRPLDPWRVAGVGLLVLGVALIRKFRGKFGNLFGNVLPAPGRRPGIGRAPVRSRGEA